VKTVQIKEKYTLKCEVEYKWINCKDGSAVTEQQ
jgi:hypothetical protein